VSFTVTNVGPVSAAGDWYDRCYILADGVLQDSDTNIGDVRRNGSLAAGASYNVAMTCTVPASSASPHPASAEAAPPSATATATTARARSPR
jgi:hypothetical protein